MAANYRAVLLGVILILMTGGAAVYLPPGIDWGGAFRPAALALLAGETPYSVETFFAAPWGLLPLIPLALLPENIGRGILFTVSITALGLAARRLRAKPVAAIAFLASPPVLHGLLNANIDWLVMLGFILPPQIGLLFVVIKPQVGVGLAVYWLFSSWQEGGVRRVLRVFAPLAVISAISFLLYGLWPLQSRNITNFSSGFNASLWPSSIPIGLALLVAAIRKREPRYAIASSPGFSPHVVFHSYAGALAALLPATAETVAAVVGLWMLTVLRAFTGGL